MDAEEMLLADQIFQDEVHAEDLAAAPPRQFLPRLTYLSNYLSLYVRYFIHNTIIFSRLFFSDPDIIHDVIPPELSENEEKSTKHYAALLTDRSSLILRNDNDEPIPNDNKNNVIATGRFTFQKKNLYYSFYISDKAARPRTLQFVNSMGTILEEHILSDVGGLVNSVYQNATRKVCGVWKRLPREYRRLLKEERLYVVLGWGSKEQSEFTLSGQLTKYVALGTELFTVVFNGIFLPDEISDVPVNVTLAFEDKKVILTEKVYVTKPATELNVVEISSPISQADLRLLTRGRLVLSVSSMSKQHSLKLSGMVMTKATCELFQTPLSSSGDRDTNKYGTSGLAWLFLNNEGSLVYNVQIEDLNPDQRPVFITLVDVGNKKRTELEDLTPSFIENWANDTIDRLSPKVLEPLYSGDLAVNVASETETSLIKGRLTPKLVADARDVAAPILLKREDRSLPTSAVGMAWFSVDSDCHVHYDVTLTGMGNNERLLELSLKFLPMSAPDAPFVTRILDEFKGNQVEGSPVEPLSKDELVRLDSGVVFVKVKDKYTRSTLMNATLKQVKVPQNCLPHIDNYVSGSVNGEEANPHTQGACFHERRFYKEEAQWTSLSDPCTMCFCQNGVVKCDTMICPETNCPPPARRTKNAGDCCYTCTNSTLEDNETAIPKMCTLLGKTYLPGTTFHPFLIPNGFDTCTLCVCDPVLLQVKCTRNGDEKLCCKNCPSVTSYTDSENQTMYSDHHTVVEVREEKNANEKSAEQILAEGGCRNPYNPQMPYRDGQKYHPVIESLGEYKCVTCKCQGARIL
ncbi:chordin [Holotrichia oblita]|uniref:Chordin n=1 Tax=Holotrichia oblita TaxID=644536 RepID=A0ACB9T0R8_HOLOL|nr:chordin [Holotrichia oblita]